VADRARTPFQLETPRAARACLVQIQYGFLSGFCSDSQQESAGFCQNLNRITLVGLNSNQSKDRLLTAGWYALCPVGCCGLLCVYVAYLCPQVSIDHTHMTWAFSERCINVCHRWTYGTSRANAERNNYSI